MRTLLWVAGSVLAAAGASAQSDATAGAIQALERGNARFVAGHTLADRTGGAAAAPFAVVVTSTDSRVVPEHLFDAAPGELVVVRTAGPVASAEAVATIEHAVEHRQVRLCVVLGHDGAEWLGDGAGQAAESPAATAVRERLAPALDRARRAGLTGTDLQRLAEEELVHLTIDDVLRRSAPLREAARTGRFRALGARYEQAAGSVTWLPQRPLPIAEADPLPPRAERASGVAPHAAMAELQDGYRRYVTGDARRPDLSRGRRAALAGGARPRTAVVACADVPIAPEHLFAAGLGELEVVRIAGNVVDDAAVAALERAVERRGVSLIVVLGHDRCGALAAAADPTTRAGRSESMRRLLERLEPAIARARAEVGDDRDALLARAAELHAQRVVTRLRAQSRSLREAEEDGVLVVLGAVLTPSNGSLRWLHDENAAAEVGGETSDGAGTPRVDPHDHFAAPLAETAAAGPGGGPADRPLRRADRERARAPGGGSGAGVPASTPTFGRVLLALLAILGAVSLLVVWQQRRVAALEADGGDAVER